MAGEWKELPFSEAVLLNPATPLARGAVYPFVEMSAIAAGTRDVKCSEHREFTGGGSRFQDRDTLMARITPCLENGKLARFQAPAGEPVGHGSTEFIVIRGRPNVTDNDYAYYLTISPEVRSFAIFQMTGTSGRQRVPTNALGGIAVPLPPLAEQKAIAAVLGALDDKIELNRRMNATLEAMARALFQSWFVDFDPVRAKLDGQIPQGHDESTAALFPNSFQDSPLGKIPKGWEIGTLGSILDVLETGRRPKGGVSSYSSGVPSIGAESINGIGVFDYSKTKFIPSEFFEKTSCGRITHFDVLLYKDGGKPGEFKPRVGMYGHDYPFKTFCINEHVFRMRSARTGQAFLYFTISDQRVLSDFAIKGGKAAIPGINQPDVKSTCIVLPPKNVTDAFNARTDILCDQILQNAKQSHSLATLRDVLIPKILSGRIKVNKNREGIAP